MSKYLNPTAIITGLIVCVGFMWAYNKSALVRKVSGGQ